MAPSFARLNSRNSVLENTIFGGYFSLQSIIRTNCHYLGFCELRRCASFSPIACSMFYAICLVCSSSIPSQIACVIIMRITIIMAALMFWRRLSKKCKTNQPMNLHQFVFVFFPQKYVKTVVSLIKSWGFNFSSLNSFHAAMIGYFIKIFKSKYRLPNFFHKSPVMYQGHIVAGKKMEVK